MVQFSVSVDKRQRELLQDRLHHRLSDIEARCNAILTDIKRSVTDGERIVKFLVKVYMEDAEPIATLLETFPAIADAVEGKSNGNPVTREMVAGAYLTEILSISKVQEFIREKDRWKATLVAVSPEVLLLHLGEIVTTDIGQVHGADGGIKQVSAMSGPVARSIKKIKYRKDGVEIEMYDRLAAADKLAKFHSLFQPQDRYAIPVEQKKEDAAGRARDTVLERAKVLASAAMVRPSTTEVPLGIEDKRPAPAGKTEISLGDGELIDQGDQGDQQDASAEPTGQGQDDRPDSEVIARVMAAVRRQRAEARTRRGG